MSEMLFFVITTIVKAVVILAVMASLAGLDDLRRKKGASLTCSAAWDLNMVGPAGVLQIVADMIKALYKRGHRASKCK